MKLLLKRTIKDNFSTIGELYIDDILFCYTLEDADRGLISSMSSQEISNIKIQNKTAIPSGTYKVIIDYSNHFNKSMPHILDVPGYEGIRIHSGNKSEDSEGCILLGTYDPAVKDWISNSRDTFSAFFLKLQHALDILKQEVVITIS